MMGLLASQHSARSCLWLPLVMSLEPLSNYLEFLEVVDFLFVGHVVWPGDQNIGRLVDAEFQSVFESVRVQQ